MALLVSKTTPFRREYNILDICTHRLELFLCKIVAYARVSLGIGICFKDFILAHETVHKILNYIVD